MSEKKIEKIDLYDRIARYGLLFALSGIICYIFLFPSGMYYCFFCGAIAASSAIIAKMNGKKKGTTLGLILGLFDIGLSAMAYYGLLLVFTAMADPESGHVITDMMSEMLSQYGISMDLFSEMVSGL